MRNSAKKKTKKRKSIIPPPMLDAVCVDPRDGKGKISIAIFKMGGGYPNDGWCNGW